MYISIKFHKKTSHLHAKFGAYVAGQTDPWSIGEIFFAYVNLRLLKTAWATSLYNINISALDPLKINQFLCKSPLKYC